MRTSPVLKNISPLHGQDYFSGGQEIFLGCLEYFTGGQKPPRNISPVIMNTSPVIMKTSPVIKNISLAMKNISRLWCSILTDVSWQRLRLSQTSELSFMLTQSGFSKCGGIHWFSHFFVLLFSSYTHIACV